VSDPMNDPVAALLLDSASGAATGAEALMAAAAAEMNPALRSEARLLEQVGALLMEAQSPRGAMTAPAPRAAGHDDLRAAFATVRAAREAPDALAWRRPLPHVRMLRLGLADARLVRIAAGHGLPQHDHGGEELTLVLRGAFSDDAGAYGAGAIAVAKPGVVHAPRAQRDCVCLIVSAAPMRFRGLLAQAAYHLLWR